MSGMGKTHSVAVDVDCAIEQFVSVKRCIVLSKTHERKSNNSEVNLFE
jgi:hypothetical protein